MDIVSQDGVTKSASENPIYHPSLFTKGSVEIPSDRCNSVPPTFSDNNSYRVTNKSIQETKNVSDNSQNKEDQSALDNDLNDPSLSSDTAYGTFNSTLPEVSETNSIKSSCKSLCTTDVLSCYSQDLSNEPSLEDNVDEEYSLQSYHSGIPDGWRDSISSAAIMKSYINSSGK